MTNEEKARILNLVLSGQQPKINEIFGLKPADILSVECMATPYQTTNTRALVKTAHGTREFHYNRQSLAEAISNVLGANQLNAVVNNAAIATALTTAGVTLDTTDIVVTALGTTAVKIAASNSNVRYYGSVNVGLTNVGDTEQPEEPEEPVESDEILLTKATVRSPLELFKFGDNALVDPATLVHNLVSDITYDRDSRTTTILINGTFVESSSQEYTIPVYLGNVAFGDYIVAQVETDPTVAVARISANGEQLTLTAGDLIAYVRSNSHVMYPMPFHIPEFTYVIELSVNGFTTPADAYTLNLINNLVYSEPENPATAGFNIRVDPAPQLYVTNLTNPVAMDTMLENGNITAVTNKVNKTITLTLEGTYIGPEESKDMLLVPMYLGNTDFYSKALSQKIAGTDGNTPFVRMTSGEDVVDISLTSLLTLNRFQGALVTPLTLSSPNSSVKYRLSTDNFVTSGVEYTLIVVNNLVFPA